MKIIDVAGHLTMPLSREENNTMKKIGDKYSADELNEREKVVATNLVTRGALHRKKIDGKIYFLK